MPNATQIPDQPADITFRYATRDDLPAIVALLADDEKGKTREEFTDPLPDAYYAAFVIDPAGNNVEAVFQGSD